MWKNYMCIQSKGFIGVDPRHLPVSTRHCSLAWLQQFKIVRLLPCKLSLSRSFLLHFFTITTPYYDWTLWMLTSEQRKEVLNGRECERDEMLKEAWCEMEGNMHELNWFNWIIWMEGNMHGIICWSEAWHEMEGNIIGMKRRGRRWVRCIRRHGVKYAWN